VVASLVKATRIHNGQSNKAGDRQYHYNLENKRHHSPTVLIITRFVSHESHESLATLATRETHERHMIPEIREIHEILEITENLVNSVITIHVEARTAAHQARLSRQVSCIVRRLQSRLNDMAHSTDPSC
jgi:hypothetical protein